MSVQPNRQNLRAVWKHLRASNLRAPHLAAALDRRPVDSPADSVVVVDSETVVDSYLDMLDSATAVQTSSAARSVRQPIRLQARSPMPKRQELPMSVSWPTSSLAFPLASTVPLPSQ